MTEFYHAAVMASKAYLDTWGDSHLYDQHWYFDDPKTGAAVHVARMGRTLYILPRGLEPRDYRDWITVLRAGDRDFGGLPGKVHKGMALAWEALESRVLRAVVDCMIDDPTLDIRLCGHSMGGALCRFAHWKLLSFTPRVKSWTFGAPGQFSSRAAITWSTACDSTNFHLVNGMDFVPWIARVGGWKQGGRLVYLDRHHKQHVGWSTLQLWWYRILLLSDRGPLTGGLRDHEIQAYIDALVDSTTELTGQTQVITVEYPVQPSQSDA